MSFRPTMSADNQSGSPNDELISGDIPAAQFEVRLPSTPSAQQLEVIETIKQHWNETPFKPFPIRIRVAIRHCDLSVVLKSESTVCAQGHTNNEPDAEPKKTNRKRSGPALGKGGMKKKRAPLLGSASSSCSIAQNTAGNLVKGIAECKRLDSKKLLTFRLEREFVSRKY